MKEKKMNSNGSADCGKGISGITQNLRKLVESAGNDIGERLAAHLSEMQTDQVKDRTALPDTGAPGGTPLDQALALVYRLSTAPFVLGRVIDVHDYETGPGKKIAMVRIAAGNRIVEVYQPKDLEPKSGDTVRLNAQTSQIIGYSDQSDGGILATVREVGDGYVVVDVGGSSRNVHPGSSKDLARGDRVVLDEMQVLVVHALPKDSMRFALKQKPKNTFADIVGHDEVVKLLSGIVEIDPKTDPIAKFYGRSPITGCFLYGPPGCGKTMLGEAVAAALGKKYGVEALASGYLYIVVPDFLDKFVGETERALRSCFEYADRHFKEHGYPATIVLDECEALFSRRGSGKSSDMEKTLVPTLLGLLNNTTALVLLMTNRPDVIDPAVTRDGRCGRQIYVGRPTRENAVVIIAKNFAKYPIDPSGSSVEALVRIATEGFYDPSKHLIDEPLVLANGEKAFFTLANIVNGAMLARLVENAAAFAEERDRASKKTSGISDEDVMHSLASMFADKKRLNHEDELDEFYRSMKNRLCKDTLLQSTGS